MARVYSIQRICEKVSRGLAAGRWFSPGIPVSSTNKTDLHDITEILLKVALNIIIKKLKYQKKILPKKMHIDMI
jgi:hypothetical protein